MKVAILTYHKTTNYGAMFQAYALQKKIKKLNTDVEILDYSNKTLRTRYSINPFIIINIKSIIKKILSLRNNFILKKKFEKFSEKYICLSKEKYNEDSILNSVNKYDKFIVGSDQVWNLKLSGNDLNYFLDFVKNDDKRNSYAASFGVNTFSKEEEIKIKKCLRNFNNISVREKSGLEILKKLDINSAIQNIDPVFLLNREEWDKLLEKVRIKEKKYILVYEITYTPNLIKYAKEYAKKNNLEVIFISGSNRKINGFKNKNNLSPEEFLMYLKNANTIITSSFHGVALSIIYQKEFYYDLPNSNKSTGSRITSLVNLLDIKNKLIESEYKETQKINYKKVNKLLLKEINESEKYLNKIISEQ